MITWKKAYERNPVFIASAIFIMVVLSLQFTIIDGGASLLNPALGMALVFAWVFGKESYVPIGLGAFLAQFIMRIFIYQTPLMTSVFLALFFMLVLIMQVEVGVRLARRYNLQDLEYRFSLKSGITFTLAAFFIAGLGAYFGNIALIITGIVNCCFYRCFLAYGFGDMMGILIMVPSGILGYKHDKELLEGVSLLALLKLIIFITAFVWLSLLLANNTWFFNFERHKYIIIIFYISIGFLFTYRMIHYFTLFFILAAMTFYAQNFSDLERFTFYIFTIIFLVFSTMITLAIKRFHDIRMRQSSDVTSNNRALDIILTEVYALLRLSSELLDAKESAQSQYLERTFNIAYTLFKGIDAGYCYQVKDGVLSVVSSRIYDIKDIPYLYETQEVIEKERGPLHVFYDFKETLKIYYGENFGIFDEEKHPLKGRIIIPLYYQSDEYFVIVLDRFNHQAPIEKIQLERLRHFSLLLDSLYKRNYFILRNTYLKDEVVLSMVRTLELYDPYTRGHSEDVAYLASEMAKRLGHEAHFITEVYWAGILHDIGKVGVDYDIINKPDVLTKDEYKAVKEHANHGFNVLGQASTLKPIATIVKHHHEWWNGEGYPSKLKGEAIPLASRIISVVDMVSTMATDRPYRLRQNKQAIKAELLKYKGIQFDPVLVDLMIQLIDENLLEGHFKRNYT